MASIKVTGLVAAVADQRRAEVDVEPTLLPTIRAP
jgi:hypothetical protein